MNPIELHSLKSCDSTNTYAWNYFSENLSKKSSFDPQLFITKIQTAGKGRQGRSWNSSFEGNLYTSLLLKPDIQELPFLPLFAGIAAAKTLEPYLAANHLFHIKWPNDLRFDQKKLGGILCESKITGESCNAAVIGLGINIVQSPQSVDIETVSLKEFMNSSFLPQITNIDFTKTLGIKWSENLIEVTKNFKTLGFSYIRNEWLKYARLAKFSRYRTHDQSGNVIEIQAKDISKDGHLIALDIQSGKEIILDQPLLLV